MAAVIETGDTDPVILGVAGVTVACLVITRLVPLRRAIRARLGMDRAALLFAIGLPTSIVVWSAARQRLDVLTIAIALAFGAIQFVIMRWILREFFESS
jgi:hypothetical protein